MKSEIDLLIPRKGNPPIGIKKHATVVVDIAIDCK
jgi:hypothetical protein